MDEKAVLAMLRNEGLLVAGEAAEFAPLSGGVSSDVWLVAAPRGRWCVKAALAQLKTAAEWKAPIERAFAERAWLDWVNSRFDGFAPRVVAFDPGGPMIAMDYLDPACHPNWKAELLAGRVDKEAARQVGARLALIHDASTKDGAVPGRFDNGADFAALRIDPYFAYTAAREPAAAPRILELAADVSRRREALVHGDVSPKNILCGPLGPQFIDAECTTFGDPAFDLAFCLNHLLIKSLVVAGHREALIEAARALWEGYRTHAAWDPTGGVIRRAALLLPALMLARVRGKSPLEYLDAAAAERVRGLALFLLDRRYESLDRLARHLMEVDA